jgi:filamentous hemagglutinin family protein
MSNLNKTHLTPIASAVALALAAPATAFAVGMPGAGTVTVGQVDCLACAGGTGGPVGSVITKLASTNTLQVKAATPSVVQWGGYNPNGTNANIKALKLETNNPGFNLSPGSQLNITATGATALLNVDASGNPSTIAGKLTATGKVNLFISNANGITVTSTGSITAPVVGLIGADLAAPPANDGLPAANTVQTAFGTGSIPVEFTGTDGNIVVAGSVTTAAAGNLIVDGSGAVNVDFTNVTIGAGGQATVLGGIGLSKLTTTGAWAPDLGTATRQAAGYAAGDVTLTNAPTSLVETYANGDLTVNGISTLPALGNYGWTGTFTNNGTLNLRENVIAGADYTGFGDGYNNPWFGTPSPTGTGFVMTPVGSFVNNGTVNPGATALTFPIAGGNGLAIVANGITAADTSILNVNAGGSVALISDTGNITLGGAVQASKSDPSIAAALVETLTSGDITVSAPLTITSSGANFTASADTKGNVTISGAVNVSDTLGTGSTGLERYALQGDSVTISGPQTVLNNTATDTKQPTATLNVNQNGEPVTISAGGSLTAGNVLIGYNTVEAAVPPIAPAAPWVTPSNRVNLVADGNITATNTGNTTAGRYQDGTVQILGTNVSGSGDGVITAQVLGIQASGHLRKSQPLLTDDYWSNGLVVNTVGANPTVNLLPDGPARQFWNLRVDGDASVNSDTGPGPTFTGPTLTGAIGAGEWNPNATSQVMFMATGNITVGGSSVRGDGNLDYRGPNQTAQFYWPGLLYTSTIDSLDTPRIVGSGSITAVGSVNNSLAQPVSCCQGQYFMTNNLSIGASIFTNINSYVNYASQDQLDQYAGITYAVAFAPNEISNTLNMVPNTDIGHVYDPVAGY